MINTFLTMIYLLTIVNVFLQDWAAFLFDSVTMFHLRVLYNTERRGLGGGVGIPTQPNLRTYHLYSYPGYAHPASLPQLATSLPTIFHFCSLP